MSDVKRWYFGSYSGEVLALNTTDNQQIGEDEPHYFVLGTDYDTALSQLAALREELATAKRNEHNSEVAYKAAIEKQEELREYLERSKRAGIDYFEMLAEKTKRLANAEQRNAICAGLLDEVLNEVPHGWGESFTESELAERIRAALNKPEEAKS